MLPDRSLVALLLTTGLLAGCRSLPANPPREAGYARPPGADVSLAVLTDRIRQEHDAAASAFLPIDRAEDALAWRLMMADTAEQTLDLQYFIWHADASGLLLLDRVLRAADRGVHVRLLVDDLLLLGEDEATAAWTRLAEPARVLAALQRRAAWRAAEAKASEAFVVALKERQVSGARSASALSTRSSSGTWTRTRTRRRRRRRTCRAAPCRSPWRAWRGSPAPRPSSRRRPPRS